MNKLAKLKIQRPNCELNSQINIRVLDEFNNWCDLGSNELCSKFYSSLLVYLKKLNE